MLARLVCWILERKNLSQKDREKITNQLLKSIDALPTRAIITINEGKLFIGGAPMEGEKTASLRESATAVLNNPALKIVHDQVLYQAISIGIHQAQTTEQVQFAKAAIWYGQQEIELLKTLSQANYSNSTPGD